MIRSTVISAALFLACAHLAAAQQESRPIHVNGNKSDWKGVPVFMTDASGDGAITSDGEYHAGGDLLTLRIKNSDCEVFFLLEFAGRPDVTASLLLDLDQDSSTGCVPFLGTESLVQVGQLGRKTVPRFGDWRGCSIPERFDFSAIVETAIGKDNIEISVPVGVLQFLAPGTQGFSVHGSTGLAFDLSPDFLLPPHEYAPDPAFSESCPAPGIPNPGGSITTVGSQLPPPPPR